MSEDARIYALEEFRRYAKTHMLGFLEWCWWMPPDRRPLKVGRHTRALCERFDRAIEDFQDGKSTYLVVNLPFRHGKALTTDTPVFTPDGWKKHGELRAGDFVYGVDGKKKRITFVHPRIVDNHYLLTFADGGSVKAHANHEWLVYDRAMKQERIVETKDIARNPLPGKRPRYMICPHEHFQNDYKYLPVDAYVIGAWLGDGRSAAPDICASPQDIEVLKRCAARERKTWEATHKDTGVVTWGFSIQKGLKQLGLCYTSKIKANRREKFIPEKCLVSSREQRLQLLAGLLDTDGYYNSKEGRYTFVTCGEKLFETFKDLLSTFGWRYSVEIVKAGRISSSGIASKKDTMYVRFVPDCEIPCVLIRKRNSKMGKGRRIGIVSCELLTNTEESNCITVEGGLYCAGRNMVVTHNSDLVSRALPAYFLGRCADYQPDVIMSGYGTSLVKGFSAKAQTIISSEAYQRLYPGVKVDPIHCAKEEWCIEGSQGLVTAQGLGGAITGKGGNLIIVDDYCKNREEAESDVMRNKMWESFKDDLMTRTNSPAAIVIVCATRWHEDDVVGRIFAEMKKDPDYPRFESLVFPARKSGPDGWDILFPELYSVDWYKRQRASLGSYSSAALLDCEPVSDAMKEFKKDWLCYYDDPPPRERMNVYVFVDAASGKKKEVGKELSDRTAMQVWGFGEDENYYLLDFVYDRINLKERTDNLFDLVNFWKPNNVFYEEVGLMADIPHMQDIMNREGYHFSIVPLHQSVKKETRIRGIQPLFEAHRIWLPKFLRKVRADGQIHFPVTDMVEEEYKTFPGCRHDDGMDCLANLNHPQVIAGAHFPMARGEDDSPAVANTKWSAFR